jgi:hypothetical protein
MGKKESEAAAALGRARWKGVSKKERSEITRKAVTERHNASTPEERSAAAKKAAQARWANVKKAKKAAKKKG